MDKYANRNTYWAHLFVEELGRSGLEAVVIAPGSRSTPLAMAFATHSKITSYVHPDERGAAFMALGMALGSGKPTAVLSTSGTAAANFFPAVVEAHQANVPLLILTADRPTELRDSGTNQAIDQVKLYGDYVRWFVEASLPEANPDEYLVAAMRSLAGRAVAMAATSPAGPVHINFPFRKPLEPILVAGDVPERLKQAVWEKEAPSGIPQGEHNTGDLENLAQNSQAEHLSSLHGRPAGQPYVTVLPGRLVPSQAQIADLADLIRRSRRTLIYAGPRCPGGDFPSALFSLARLTGLPIFADALSGLRFSAVSEQAKPLLLSGYETFLSAPELREQFAPDLVIQFGALPISKSLMDYLQGAKAAWRIQVTDLLVSHSWADDRFNTSGVMRADPGLICQALFDNFQANPSTQSDTSWVERLKIAEQLAWWVVDEMRQEENFEGALLADLLDHLGDEDGLFVASSLPVRHLDQFGRARPLGLSVFANRGASGIDGTIASAVGAAASRPQRRVVLVVGDLAFLHDLNSLLAVRNYAPNLVIILINNDGGGIFERLPIAEFEPPYTRLFRLPHGLHFGAAADLFGLEYLAAEPGVNFRNTLQAILGKNDRKDGARSVLVEVFTDARQHEKVRREIVRRFEQRWASS